MNLRERQLQRLWQWAFTLALIVSFQNKQACSAAPIRQVASAPAVETFATDKRLEQAISLQVTGIPIGELLQKLSSPTLQLQAGRSCQEQKVQIRLKQRSLRDLLQSLAQLLPASWEPLDHNRGYRLKFADAANISRQRWWDLFLSERERTLAERRDLVLRQIRGEAGPPHQEFNLTPEMKAHMQAGKGFFQLLPASVQEALATRMNEAPFLGLQGFGFGTGDTEGAISFPLDSMPDTFQQFVRKHFAAQIGKNESELDLTGITISVVNGGAAVMAYALKPNSPYFADKPAHGSAFNMRIQTSLGQEVLTPRHPWITDAVLVLGKRAPENWKRLAAYQKKRVWPNDTCPDLPDGSPTPRKSDALDWIGRQADIEYVADYHSLGGIILSEDGKAQPLTRTLKIELDYQARDLDMSWKKQANAIYLFRNNRWYRDDLLEVPAPLIRRWLSTELPYAAGEAQSKENKETVPPSPVQRLKRWMDRRAEFATSLTIWQLTAGLPFVTPLDGETPAPSLQEGMKVFYKGRRDTDQNTRPSFNARHYPGGEYPLWKEASYILRHLHLVLFYAGLSEDNRMALLENRLSLPQLTPGQVQQAQYMLPDLQLLLQRTAPETIVLGMSEQVLEDMSAAGRVSGELTIVSPRSE
jgi:hypothetical protein